MRRDVRVEPTAKGIRGAQCAALANEHLADDVGQRARGRVNRPLLDALGELGLLRGLFGGAAERARVTRPRCGCACCARPRDGGHRGRDRARPAGPGQLPDPAVRPPGRRSTGGSRASSPATWSPRSHSPSPDAGSDAAALLLAAEPDGDGWRLYGEKTWISNAPEADVYTVFARTTAGCRARGVTAFAVAGDAPGLSGEHLDLLSPHAIGRLVFDGVRVERCDVLGEVDAGFRVAMRTLDLFRPSVGAFAVGMAQAALDAATLDHVDHPRRSSAHRSPSSSRWPTRWRHGDAARGRPAARVRRRGAYDAGADRGTITRSAAMAKLFATESAQYVVDQAVQMHGARALERGHLLEHLYRDVRAPASTRAPRRYSARSSAASWSDDTSKIVRKSPRDALRASVPITDDWQHFDSRSRTASPPSRSTGPRSSTR